MNNQNIQSIQNPPITPPQKNQQRQQEARQQLQNMPLPNPPTIPQAATQQPVRPGTVGSFLRSINNRLDKVHPAAKYVVWSVLGAALATSLVCAIIYAGGWQGAVKQGLKEFFNLEQGWYPIINALKVGAVGMAVVGIVASPETYRPGEIQELGKYVAIGLGIFAAYGSGIGLAFSLRH